MLKEDAAVRADPRTRSDGADGVPRAQQAAHLTIGGGIHPAMTSRVARLSVVMLALLLTAGCTVRAAVSSGEPSDVLEQFLGAQQRGAHAAAYELLSSGTQKDVPLNEFVSAREKARLAGRGIVSFDVGAPVSVEGAEGSEGFRIPADLQHEDGTSSSLRFLVIKEQSGWRVVFKGGLRG